VFLGSGATVYFKNLKHARAYLVATNKFLTLKLFDINQLYIETFAAYRLAWFDMRDNLGVVTREFNLIDQRFNKVTNLGRGPNDNAWVFKDLLLVCEGLETCIFELDKTHRQRNNFSAVWHNNTLLNRIEIIKNELNNYGKDMPVTDVYT